VRCETFVFRRAPALAGFEVSDDRGEEGSFFDARVCHDVKRRAA